VVFIEIDGHCPFSEFRFITMLSVSVTLYACGTRDVNYFQ
jgi:hypothetical protein